MVDKDPTVQHFICPKLKTRHVCLMQDTGKECQDYNAKVFDLLKKWIHNILPAPHSPHTPDTVAEQFATCCSSLLNDRGYLLNVKEIRLHKTGGMKYVPEKKDKDKPITFATSEDDKYYGLLAPFRPTVSPSL